MIELDLRESYTRFPDKILTIIGLYISETIMYIDKEHLERRQEKSIVITLAEHLTLHCTSKFEKKPSYSGRKLFNVLPVDIWTI